MASVLATILFRMGEKFICDFTCLIYLRHPNYLGGFYWLFNSVYAQFSVFAVVAFRLRYDEEHANDVEHLPLPFGAYQVFMLASALTLLWSLSFAALLIFSNRGFLYSFYSTETSMGYTKRLFLSGNDDLRVHIITRHHKSLWRHFEDEISLWMKENWQIWHRERPPWFTDRTIALIPLWLIPDAEHIFKSDFDSISQREVRRTHSTSNLFLEILRSKLLLDAENVSFNPKLAGRSSSIAEENRMQRIR